MTDPYVSFDTFTVGAEVNAPAAEPAPRPSLLARLPRVAPAPPKPKRIQRFDEAEPTAHGLHVFDSGDGLAYAGPATALAPRRAPLGDPTATIRIDTVTPTTFEDQPARATRPAPRPTPSKLSSPTPVSSLEAEDPWAAWLVNLEAAIVPYSRVIVLAAVIAAMGLTLVLLRGGRPQTDDSSAAPQVSAETPVDALATEASVAPPFSTEQAPLVWPTAPQPTELRPLTQTTAVAPSPAFAAGPASAWRGPAGARLTGEVLPAPAPGDGVLGDGGQRVEVAAKPDYPTTTR